jgi:two-component system sensor histidine kinase BaeS
MQDGRVKSLFAKIMLAQVVAVVLALLVVLVITRMSLDRGFMNFLERQEGAVLNHLASALGEVYEAQGGWGFLRDHPEVWHRILRRSRHLDFNPAANGHPPLDPEGRGRLRASPPQAMAEGEFRWLRSFDRLGLRERLFLLDENDLPIAGAHMEHWLEHEPSVPLEPIIADGETVGWIGFAPVQRDMPLEVRRFLRGQLRAHALALVVALGFVAILAYALARHLSRPVARLDRTVDDLSKGNYDQRADVTSRDEIGRLAENVNRLAQTLETNRSARHRWMTDIAHELRTPVAILKGEIEALGDGLRPANEKTFSSLSEEINHLSMLVDDLQSLALADAGELSLNRQKLELGEIVRQAGNAFRERLGERNIEIELETSEPVEISVDAQRMRQLLNNLLENCARYVVPGGTVRISLSVGAGTAELLVEDSGPGVAPGQLERLFERFYRGEAGRSRSGGGSGLGLSICRSIAEAHGGQIGAKPSALGGLAVRVTLPR